MSDKEICKKCIYYDDFCCRNNNAICVNNSEYMDAETVINAIINRKEGAKPDFCQLCGARMDGERRCENA